MACTSPTPIPDSKTAYQQWSSLGYHDKNIAGQFYGLAQADAQKKHYWDQREAQRFSTADDEPRLQHKYVAIPVPEHVDPATGTVVEQSTHAVEIVQFVEVVKSHGRTLNIVK